MRASVQGLSITTFVPVLFSFTPTLSGIHCPAKYFHLAMRKNDCVLRNLRAMPHRIGFNKNRRPHFFKQWRTKRGLSQERLAERLETSVASVSRVESGKQPY